MTKKTSRSEAKRGTTIPAGKPTPKAALCETRSATLQPPPPLAADEPEESMMTLGESIQEMRDHYDGDCIEYGDEVVLVTGDFAWVFDRAEFNAAMGVSFDRQDNGLDILLKHCVDHATSPRGKAAVRRFADDHDWEPRVD